MDPEVMKRLQRAKKATEFRENNRAIVLEATERFIQTESVDWEVLGNEYGVDGENLSSAVNIELGLIGSNRPEVALWLRGVTVQMATRMMAEMYRQFMSYTGNPQMQATTGHTFTRLANTLNNMLPPPTMAEINTAAVVIEAKEGEDPIRDYTKLLEEAVKRAGVNTGKRD